MKKTSLGMIALGASLFAAGIMLGENAPKAATPAPADKPQKLVRVSTLSTVEANREFQANVQVMQGLRQQFIEANAAADKETNATKKKELKAKADDLFAKLNENNQKMVKAYGFSLDRNYLLVVEVAHVYMAVSEEEAARYEKEQAAANAAAATAKTK